MAKINGARKGNAKRDLADKQAQQKSLEEKSSLKKTTSRAEVMRPSQLDFMIVPYKSLMAAHQAPILAKHSDARGSGRKLVIAFRGVPRESLATGFQPLRVSTSMDHFRFNHKFVYLKVSDCHLKVYRRENDQILYKEFPCSRETIPSVYKMVLDNIDFI